MHIFIVMNTINLPKCINCTIWLSLLIIVASSCSSKMVTNNRDHERTVTKSAIEENKALILNFYKALNEFDFLLAQTMTAPGYKHYYVKDSGFGFLPWKGFEQGFKYSLKAFPDWKLTPITMVAEGEYVFVLLKGEGTHLGSFAGIEATNVKAGTPIMLLHQVREHKLIADWEMVNTNSFLEQLKKR